MLTKFRAWMREEGCAGQYLKRYESARYDWTDFDMTTIVVSPYAEQLGDVSFWQAGMDWTRYPWRSAVVRIGQNVWKDTSFETFYAAARAQKIALGGYFFWDDRATPEQQAQVIIQAMAGKYFELELWIDVEKFYGGAYGGTNAPRNIRRIIELVEAAGVKCKQVGIYTGYYFWKDNILPNASDSDRAFFAARPLWLAWYASASVVKVPLPWTDYTLWQWGTPAVYWGQPTAEVDANKSRYASTEFTVRYLGGTTPPTGGTMKGKMYNYTVNVRSAAGVAVTQLHKDDVVYGEVFTDNRERIRFGKVYRVGGIVENLGQECTAVTNDAKNPPLYYMNLTNEQEPGTEPPPPVVTSRTVTVTVEEAGWKPVTVEVTQERG